jgi:hypothetical protein
MPCPSCHWCEISAAVLGFAGAALLSVDAILGKRRVFQEAGKNAAQEGAEMAGATYVDDRGQPIRGESGIKLWFAARSQRWNRAGFLLMTAGFLMDLAGKW